MNHILALTAAIAGVVTHSAVEAAAPNADAIEVAFVANAEAGTVALLDVATRSIFGVIDINPAHTERKGPGATNYAQDTDVSPDGRTLYVSRGYLGDVAAFDIASARMLWQRSLNTGRADHMTLTPDGKTLFVSALMDNRVYRIVAASGEITGHVVTGVYPHDNKISRDGRRLYNSSLGPLGSLPRSSPAPSDTPGAPFQLTIADVDTLAVRDSIELDNAFRPWHFAADEKVIYAQRSNEHAVVAYGLESREVTRRLDLPVKDGVTSKDWDFEAPHHGLALTDDGETLCLAGRASDYAALVRARDLSLIATIPAGDAPGWAEVADHGRVCLIANTRSDDLSIISIADRAEIARLPVGNGPKHITVAEVPRSVVAALKPVAKPQRISYGKEATSFGELLLPEGKGPFPVAVLVHGGCWLARQGSVDGLRPLAEALAKRGVATWNIEYRRVGHEGGGWPGTYTDLAGAADFLRTLGAKYPLNLDRVVLAGHSSGGYFAAWIAGRRNLPRGNQLSSRDPIAVAGLVPIDAFLDPRVIDSRGLDGDLYCGEPILSRLFGGELGAAPDHVRQGSPLALLPYGVPQTYVVSSRRYPVTPVRPLADGRTTIEVADYPRLAQAAGDSVEVRIVPDADHIDFVKPSTAAGTAVQAAIVDLLQRPRD